MRAADLRRLAHQDAIAILPIGSTEQHGPHLPVQVDSLLAFEVARRAASRVVGATPVVVLPVVWTGLAEHHMAFGGTVTLDLASFGALIHGIVESVARHGFRRVLLLNGHGGNIQALKALTADISVALDVPLAMATYFTLAAGPIAEILECQDRVRHAGEAESSMILALRPSLVDRSRLSEAFGPDEPELDGRDVQRWRSFADRTETGVIGDARTASAEKGERLLEAASSAVADLLLDPRLWELE